MARRSRTKTKTKTKRQSRSSDDSDYEEDCRPRKRTKSRLVTVKGKETVEPDLSDSDITVREGVAQHPKSLHDIHHVREVREALLRWFAGVHGIREMPWRKQFDPNMSPKERNQRAYEVGVYSFSSSTQVMKRRGSGLGIRGHASTNPSSNGDSLL